MNPSVHKKGSLPMKSVRILSCVGAALFCFALIGCGGSKDTVTEIPTNPLPPPKTGPGDLGGGAPITKAVNPAE
jgi:hypothetical protein